MKSIGEMKIRVRRGSLACFGEAVGEEGGEGDVSGVRISAVEMLKKGSSFFLRRLRTAGGEGGGLGGRGECERCWWMSCESEEAIVWVGGVVR